MSEELFVRGIVSLILTFAISLLVEYRYGEELEEKESKGQKYRSYIPSGLLIGLILGRTVFVFISSGAVAAKQNLISICFDLFLHISVYYSVLLLLISRFRKRISARVCAVLWMIPNYLYYMFLSATQLQKPIRVVKIPGNYVEFVFDIWLLGFAGVLCYGIVSHLRFRSELLKDAKPVEDEQILELWKEQLKWANMRYTEYPLVISSKVKTPLSVGMFPSTIHVVLPERRYSLEELKLIFRHEIVHIGRDDAGNKFSILFFTAMCWYNPLMWIAMRKNADDLELSCDETVLLESDMQLRRQYANLILDAAGDERGFTTCLSASAKSLKYRLQNIIKPNVRNSGVFTLAITLFLLCMSCGHVALAYGEYTGENIVYRRKNTELYEISQMYLVEEETSGSTFMECVDTEAFHEYMENLKIQDMTGNYSFDDSEKTLSLTFESAEGMKMIQLKTYVIRIISFDENDRVWRSFYLPEGLDWEYLETILFPVSDFN